MKRIVVLIFYIFLCLHIEAQLKGIDLSEAILLPESGSSFETLYYHISDEGVKNYYITYHYTPMGIKHCFGLVRDILDENGKDFNSPDKDDSTLPDFVKGLTDYEGIHTACEL
jgi:hypothetical protein